MYQVLLYLHVLGAFIYFLLHGGVASVTFVLRREQHPEGARALEAILDLVYGGALLSLGVTILSGILLGFIGGWWRTGWFWTSLVLLAVIGIVMRFLGNPYIGRQFRRIYEAGAPSNPEAQEPPDPSPEQPSPGMMERHMPVLLTLVGVGGMAAILWLMMFKPF